MKRIKRLRKNLEESGIKTSQKSKVDTLYLPIEKDKKKHTENDEMDERTEKES